MTPFTAAHQILTEVDALDVPTIKAAVTASVLVAADDLPVSPRAISVSVSKRAKRRLGQCKFHRLREPDGSVSTAPFEINISLAGAALAPRRELADTIAHEVAHAAVGHEEGHSFVWEHRARLYGATPTACSNDKAVERSWRFAYYCATCRAVTGRQAGRPKYRRRCQRCHALVATVDLRERKIIPGHSLLVDSERDSDVFSRIVRETIDDYRMATAAVLTLSRTA